MWWMSPEWGSSAAEIPNDVMRVRVCLCLCMRVRLSHSVREKELKPFTASVPFSITFPSRLPSPPFPSLQRADAIDGIPSLFPQTQFLLFQIGESTPNGGVFPDVEAGDVVVAGKRRLADDEAEEDTYGVIFPLISGPFRASLEASKVSCGEIVESKSIVEWCTAASAATASGVLQCVAVCCSVLRCAAAAPHFNTLQSQLEWCAAASLLIVSPPRAHLCLWPPRTWLCLKQRILGRLLLGRAAATGFSPDGAARNSK